MSKINKKKNVMIKSRKLKNWDHQKWINVWIKFKTSVNIFPFPILCYTRKNLTFFRLFFNKNLNDFQNNHLGFLIFFSKWNLHSGAEKPFCQSLGTFHPPPLEISKSPPSRLERVHSYLFLSPLSKQVKVFVF